MTNPLDLEALLRVVDVHSLHPVIDRIFPFDDAKAAFTHYFDGAPVIVEIRRVSKMTVNLPARVLTLATWKAC